MIQKKSRHESQEVVYDFSTISWKGAELSKLKEHLVEHIDLIAEYPEREAESIVRLLSRRHEVKEDQVIVTDGATGALHLISSVSKGATSLILPPTNQEFRHALDRAGHITREQAGIKDLSKLDLTDINYLWICNPNTPDGRFFNRRSILNLLREHPEVTVVVDLSMSSYVVEDNIKASDIKKYPNLIVVGSFSRAYNIPGMRVGYTIASKDKIAQFRDNYTPRCVGSLALEAARYILLHPAQFTIPIRKWLRDSLELAETIETLYGMEVIYGSTPYFVVRLSHCTADELADYLSKKHYIKVGTRKDDLDLQENEIRICGFIGAKYNDTLVEALKEFQTRFVNEDEKEEER